MGLLPWGQTALTTCVPQGPRGDQQAAVCGEGGGGMQEVPSVCDGAGHEESRYELGTSIPVLECQSSKFEPSLADY